ncbi:hypothetical protein OCAR_6634 [Afipia carboxidovorans OM5]|uniref:Uncharacterized protein n=1 Tax=Afipia carboxidovorans (strain ATCC 49405 / DSM 1227 / KCTC 32145 / OM5) TaxID=504832 RepID=B6JG14_AFIC5|nr:hypothetical protein [Afipia carboxidovorans]ACI93746.1 hypothetical protein OCAR_6634 [Afipia carboxidovorans OM5]AEI02572.1 hypothetical protein OCA4_c14320 [Afipia carboxidovorans OM4]AEI06148.1 hypothetical protein OCA5_c14320 [Afipia carboxidovorans OM5]BEV46942.1 hypothetical protein CRBSH125_31250 [Afipia carboxidovorans]
MDEIQITQVELPQHKRTVNKPAKGTAKRGAKVHKLDASQKPAAKPSHTLSRKKTG